MSARSQESECRSGAGARLNWELSRFAKVLGRMMSRDPENLTKIARFRRDSCRDFCRPT